MYLRNNFRERKIIYEYQKLGYEVLTKGWPDLLAIKGKEIIMIEVKRKQKKPTPYMGLSKHQRRMHEILKSLGLNIIVKYV